LHSAELILFCFSFFLSIYPFKSPWQPFFGMSPHKTAANNSVFCPQCFSCK